MVTLDDGRTISSRTVLIATGARYRKLDVPRPEDFEGTSVYYAATQLEAERCRHDPIAIVGGGNSAGQAALFLAKHAASVWMLVRADNLDLCGDQATDGEDVWRVGVLGKGIDRRVLRRVSACLQSLAVASNDHASVRILDTSSHGGSYGV